jgi:hypothetical protein
MNTGINKDSQMNDDAALLVVPPLLSGSRRLYGTQRAMGDEDFVKALAALYNSGESTLAEYGRLAPTLFLMQMDNYGNVGYSKRLGIRHFFTDRTKSAQDAIADFVGKAIQRESIDFVAKITEAWRTSVDKNDTPTSPSDSVISMILTSKERELHFVAPIFTDASGDVTMGEPVRIKVDRHSDKKSVKKHLRNKNSLH